MIGDELILFDPDELSRDLWKAGAEQEADTLQLPDFLQSPQKLAQMLYEFWINSMETDRVEFASLVYANDDTTLPAIRILPPKFEDLDVDARMNLVEAVQTNMTQPLLRIFQELAADQTKMQAAVQSQQVQNPQNQQTTPTHLCYCCGGQYVSRPGQACSYCTPRRP